MDVGKVSVLVRRLVAQFFAFGARCSNLSEPGLDSSEVNSANASVTALEDEQISVYDELRLLISSIILNEVSLIKQVLSLSGPVAAIFTRRGQLSEATRRLKDALALIELYVATFQKIQDKKELVEEEIQTNIMIAKSYEARALIAGADRELCLRVQYFWSAALFLSVKYGIQCA